MNFERILIGSIRALEILADAEEAERPQKELNIIEKRIFDLEIQVSRLTYREWREEDQIKKEIRVLESRRDELKRQVRDSRVRVYLR